MITAKNYKTFWADLTAALAAVEAKYEVKIQTGSAKLDSAGVTNMRIQVIPKVAGKLVDPAAEIFKKYAYRYDMTPENLEQVFVIGGKKYMVSGLKTSNYKLPILAVSLADGRTYKFPTATVKAALAA